ncbi:hypothetical protein GCM10010112_23650 [Actinoplanes lobatus]|uniref:Uncharacterized protein n=1 Tax=Actinoplanes lobatus TaxID=113568 RepID=A0A7W7HIZ6_9ACTN|nr:hypothetical protein [Actinoplanes lobatus]MBB4751407.1 hypothetical protein [Actinoplanes lobatus]GGN63946.1 hypothetical protein GCM10010112_23650 [Actinoplanes lobatus]GIE41016.1 hypothetical protein Alo02nite_39140 [Actinoplanes lobatus]
MHGKDLEASNAPTVLGWLEREGPRSLLTTLATASGPVTHETLDAHPAKFVSYPRAALVAHQALPERDEHLASFIRWLPAQVDAVQDPGDRHTLRRYLTWTHLRRLRAAAERGPLVYGQLAGPRGERPTGRTIIGREAQHPWLFPGGHAGRHISAARMGIRLTDLGFSTRAGRATALMELGAELPPVVLSKLLGIHIHTATAWSQAAGHTRTGYTAALSRRRRK